MNFSFHKINLVLKKFSSFINIFKMTTKDCQKKNPKNKQEKLGAEQIFLNNGCTDLLVFLLHQFFLSVKILH